MNFLSAKKLDSNNEFIHLNLKLIGFIRVNKETEDGLILETSYRKKATEKLLRFKSAHDKEGFRKFIAKYNFYLLENCFINIDSIDFVDEEIIDRSNIKLNFYFKDGQHLTIKTKITRWEGWRNLRLK